MTHRSSQLRIWLPVAPLLTARSLTGSAVGRVNQAAQLALESQPFQAASSDAPRRLPIVGESTGVGTGATDPIRRLAGLLSQSSPCLHTNNQARAQPSWVLGATRWDALLSHFGGNDVIRLRDWQSAQASITPSIRHALGPWMVVPVGNVGNAPLLFPPLSLVMTNRAERLHSLVREAVQAQGVEYVNHFEGPKDWSSRAKYGAQDPRRT